MKEITKLDILIVCTVIFVMAVRIFTIIFMAKTAALTGAEIEQVMTIYESNPMAKYFMNLKTALFLFSPFIILAIAIIDYLVFAIILPKLFKYQNTKRWYYFIPATTLEFGC